MNGTISNNSDERGLLPYPVILAATKGDPDCKQSSCGLSLTSRQINAKCKASPFPLCAFNLTLTLLLDKESDAR